MNRKNTVILLLDIKKKTNIKNDFSFHLITLLI